MPAMTFGDLVPSAPGGRFAGIERPYSPDEAARLRGSLPILHQLNYGMFELVRGYCERQMAAYAELREAEFSAESSGYTATRHQREVGTAYFDAVALTINSGLSSTTAMAESTEAAQFATPAVRGKAA